MITQTALAIKISKYLYPSIFAEKVFDIREQLNTDKGEAMLSHLLYCDYWEDRKQNYEAINLCRLIESPWRRL